MSDQKIMLTHGSTAKLPPALEMVIGNVPQGKERKKPWGGLKPPTPERLNHYQLRRTHQDEGREGRITTRPAS